MSLNGHIAYSIYWMKDIQAKGQQVGWASGPWRRTGDPRTALLRHYLGGGAKAE